MNKLINQIELIERVDQLIRLRATGNPRRLAERFDVSESTIYRLIETIKDLGAPVEFNLNHQSYIYTDEVNFMCGFFAKEFSRVEYKKVNGGFQTMSTFLNNFITVKI